jgi:hypothetical protein
VYVPLNSDAPTDLHLHGGSDRLGSLPATWSIFSLTASLRRAAQRKRSCNRFMLFMVVEQDRYR